MLSKDLYILSNYLCSNITYDKTALNALSYLDSSILSYLDCKNNFIKNWLDKSKFKATNIEFTYNYNIIDQNSEFIKIILNIHKKFYSYDIASSSIDSYLIILKHYNKSYKIIFLLSNEDTPLLYSSILHSSLERIYSYVNINSILQSFWNDKLKILEEIHSDFSKINLLSVRKTSTFDIKSACEYAQKYAINLNPEYKDFTNTGGDCTNFVSQILKSGKLETTKTWHPYSNAWVRVKELYDYLINNNIAKTLPHNIGLDKGCVIQFLIPTTNRFSHTAFITHNIPNVDFLYCCHSYNKLNYPLSLTYPVLYKSMRSLIITK